MNWNLRYFISVLDFFVYIDLLKRTFTSERSVVMMDAFCPTKQDISMLTWDKIAVLQFGECKDPENHADRIQFAFESLLGPKTTRDTWEEIKQLQQFCLVDTWVQVFLLIGRHGILWTEEAGTIARTVELLHWQYAVRRHSAWHIACLWTVSFKKYDILMFRIFEKCISRSKPKLWGALILTKSLEQGPLGVHGFQSVAKLFFNNIFMQTIFQDIHIDSVIQLTWKRWKGVGSGQKFAFLARGQPWSKIQDTDSSIIESSSHRQSASMPRGLETAANGLVKEANLDFARTHFRHVTYLPCSCRGAVSAQDWNLQIH